VLDSITAGNPANPVFNEAVLYTSLLDEGGFHTAVRAFAAGDLKMFKSEFASAVGDFSQAAALIKEGKVAEWCRYQEAMAYRAAGKPQEAIATLDSFITAYPTSVDLDRAIYNRALIQLEDLNDAKGAQQALEKFLVDYPRSIYLEQARRKARILAAKVS
jgi:outer membrane protein assembly factor BamD (BamD/ComL family)